MAQGSLPPYPSGRDWKEWALQLLEYMQDRSPREAEVNQQAIALQHQRPTVLERAEYNGILMWDETQKAVVVSKDGAWATHQTLRPNETGFMVWMGAWAAGTYYRNQVVSDGIYTAVCVVDSTTDRPATQPPDGTLSPDWALVANTSIAGTDQFVAKAGDTMTGTLVQQAVGSLLEGSVIAKDKNLNLGPVDQQMYLRNRASDNTRLLHFASGYYFTINADTGYTQLVTAGSELFSWNPASAEGNLQLPKGAMLPPNSANTVASTQLNMHTNFGRTGWVDSRHVAGAWTGARLNTVQNLREFSFRANGAGYAIAGWHTGSFAASLTQQSAAIPFNLSTILDSIDIEYGREVGVSQLDGQPLPPRFMFVHDTVPDALKTDNAGAPQVAGFVDTGGIVALLVKEVQELRMRVANLEGSN